MYGSLMAKKMKLMCIDLFMIQIRNHYCSMIGLIQKINRRYLVEDKYVYKKCSDTLRKDKSRKWLVILKKIRTTKTNEERKTIDPKTAKFRASELRVVRIINLNDPTKTIRYLVNDYEGKKIKYRVGEIVRPDTFDEDINCVCSNGIHYFKSIEPAIFYGGVPTNYTGIGMNWYEDGQKREEQEYLDGKPTGRWQIWHTNGQKWEEGEYLDGKPTGRWQIWHSNGQKWEEREYLDGIPTGRWYKWYPNGRKYYEGCYLEGKKIGQWNEWHVDGQKWMDCHYLKGKLTGTQCVWYPNGHKSYECSYLNGERSGRCQEWNIDGQKSYEGCYLEGVRTGRCQTWYAVGQIWEDGEYLNGKKIGIWQSWDIDGKKFDDTVW
jgi:antitoxin component YwqK of YwqJK toxin-antitoxin module